MKKIAILGFGTIGSGVAEIISTRNDMRLVKVLDLRDLSGTLAEAVATKDIHDVINSDADIVVETMGGVHPAADFISAALQSGKSVVTSNKAVIAAVGEKLQKIADESGTKLLYEASVGGRIPIVRVMQDCLACDEITKIRGILNGTTNYILTEMAGGKSYEEALTSAQKLGYAEANPSADIEGIDTCRKIAILASIMMGKKINYEDIPCEGIENITKEDIDAAAAKGKKIKLIGYAEKDGDKLIAYVKPVEIDSSSMLYGIDGVTNGIELESKYLGTSLYCGAGAGKLATATAVIADIMHI